MNTLEHQAIRRIVSFEATAYPALVAQLGGLVVTSRRYTDVGVYTDFGLDAAVEPCRACPRALRLGGTVLGAVGSQGALVGFVLYVDEGVITTLESFVYDGRWPADAEEHVRWV